MNNTNETEKVIVINGKTLKVINFLARMLISILAAVIVSIGMSFFIGYYEFFSWWGMPFLNNYNLYRLVLFIVFFAGSGRVKDIGKLVQGIYRFNQNYILRSIGVEIFAVNILSLIVYSFVYSTASRLSREGYVFNIPTALFFAVPAYVICMYLLTRGKIKYVEEIAQGITEISKGNLDFKVVERGSDELKVLAENINSMSIELKKKIEDERKAEQTKNELITNVSHDLKTPLTTIIGYLTLVKDKRYDGQENMEDYIERAYSKSLRLKKLIEDLFEYTKISNGVIRFNPTRVNIIELMEQLLGEMSVIARTNNLSFEKNYSNSEIYVDIDSDLMARTFENIISNAIKYSYKELNSRIYVNIIEEEDSVKIEVENHGDTIPTEILPLLFERFYRVDKSRSSKISGSGLGLAIAKSIVELHKGEIQAESDANKIKVTVTLKRN